MDTCRVVTISRECDSRGQQVAEALSQAMGFDLFHHEIVEGMIKQAQGLNAEDAQKVMVRSDANRRAFIGRYYNADARIQPTTTWY